MRIWVTGLGVVSPLARGAAATMDGLVEGRRAIGPLTLFELAGGRVVGPANVTIAAEVAGLRGRGGAAGPRAGRAPMP